MAERPRFDVPSGKAARVSIIDSTLRLSNMPLSHLMKPPMKGMEIMPVITTWSFLVESSSGKKALFDLGVPKNPMENFSPMWIKLLTEHSLGVEVSQNVADILKDNNVQPSEIDSVIWRSRVGPTSNHGCKIANGPWRGRSFREINFEESPLQIGPFRAFDFFGDGSFYLLDTPGHAIGHLAGLACTTTNPDTFILMGGDLCHHGGEIRPSQYLPYPKNLSEHLSLTDSLRLRLSQCPGSMFDDLNVKRGRKPGETFFDPAIGSDIEQAIQTIRDAQQADAQDNIFFLPAHDMSVAGVIDQFPNTANDWKAKGWREKTFWKFLQDFEAAISTD
ncbi:hypothetical protein ACHAPA_010636 [Fusarium lateritium]